MAAAIKNIDPSAKQNWSFLRVGQLVTVVEPERAPYRAVIDDTTQDGGVVWVISDRTRLRRAFDHREGVVVAPA